MIMHERYVYCRFQPDSSGTVSTLNFANVPATAGLSAPLFALAGRMQNFSMRFTGEASACTLDPVVANCTASP